MGRYKLHAVLACAIFVIFAADIWFAAVENKPTATLLLLRYIGMAIFLLAVILFLRRSLRYLFLWECWFFAACGVATFGSAWLITDYSGSISYTVLGTSVVPVWSYIIDALIKKHVGPGFIWIVGIAASAVFVFCALEEFNFSRIDFNWVWIAFTYAFVFSSEIFAIRLYTIRQSKSDIPFGLSVHALLCACLFGIAIIFPLQVLAEVGIFKIPEVEMVSIIRPEIYWLLPFLIFAAIFMNLVNMTAASKLDNLDVEVVWQVSLFAICVERLVRGFSTSVLVEGTIVAGLLVIAFCSYQYLQRKPVSSP